MKISSFVCMLTLRFEVRDTYSVDSFVLIRFEATANETKLSTEASSMVRFYEASDYAPFALEGFNFTLSTTVLAPARGQNRVVIEVTVARFTYLNALKSI